MKRFLFLFAALLVMATAKAQIYDGITQPTTYRLLLPVTQSLDGGNPSVAPFIGYKYQPAKWFSVTPVVQYNINNETFIPQVWLNFNVKQRFYILSRSIYNARTNIYSHTLSATMKLPLGFMIDGTWDNLYNGRKFAKTDRLQFVAGYAHKWFVLNAGYSMRNYRGFIANIRFKVTEYNWLQLKYDGGVNAITAQVVLQFN